MDQRINCAVYMYVKKLIRNVNPWISYWALALVHIRKWEITPGKEKIFELSGNQTHNYWCDCPLLYWLSYTARQEQVVFDWQVSLWVCTVMYSMHTLPTVIFSTVCIFAIEPNWKVSVQLSSNTCSRCSSLITQHFIWNATYPKLIDQKFKRHALGGKECGNITKLCTLLLAPDHGTFINASKIIIIISQCTYQL